MKLRNTEFFGVCYRLDTLELLQIARARKNGKTLLNEQFEFIISPLLKLAIEYD